MNADIHAPTLTAEELMALIAILNRTPMTPGERLWVQGLVNRLQLMVEPDEQDDDGGDSD